MKVTSMKIKFFIAEIILIKTGLRLYSIYSMPSCTCMSSFLLYIFRTQSMKMPAIMSEDFGTLRCLF